MSTLDGREKTRVIILEDEGLFRDLLRLALSRYPKMEVVGAFGDGEAVLAAAGQLHPDVAILDIELRGGLNGIQVGLELRRQLPKLGIVLLSNHQDPQFLASVPTRAVAGWSYLLKKSVSDLQALGRAIEGAAAGFVVLDPQLLAASPVRQAGRMSRLTPRQSEVLHLIAQGFTNAAIAERLSLAEKSVENQINLLYQELEIDRGDPSLQPRVKAVLTYLEESQPGLAGRSTWG